MRAFGYSKPHPSEVVSGDAYLFVQIGDSLRVALVDGAGHGEAASKAATRAVETLKASADQPLAVALSRCHDALHHTRGAAISLADIGQGQILFAGMGNVEGRLVTASRQSRLVPQRGTAGVVVPRIRPEAQELPSTEWAFFMYSDGISHRVALTWDAVGSVAADSASCQELLVRLVNEWGRLTDDATLVLVLPEAPNLPPPS